MLNTTTEKCEACNRTAYQNAKAKYETQKERLAGQYKAKTVMFQTTLFLLAWYSLTTTLFQAVQSDVLLSDCKSFFHDAASFIQTFIGWTIDAGQSVAQISDISCWNIRSRNRDTCDTDRNKDYRII